MDSEIDADVRGVIEHAVSVRTDAPIVASAAAGNGGGQPLPSSIIPQSSHQLANTAAASASAAVASPATPTAEVWLRLALMSVARQDHAEYLLKTLYAILEQMPPGAHALRSATDVVVVNNHEPSSSHRVFRDAERLYAHRVRFVTKAASGCAPRSGSRVKASVQRQTCDLAAAFRALLGVVPIARHVMLMEDDWLLCPHGLAAVHYAIEKAYRYDHRWLALRVSYGFNGVIVPQAELQSLSSHLEHHSARRPPDHLLFEWFSGERPETKERAAGRSYRIFRYNLFHHIGHISTLAQPKGRFNPGCYSLLYDWLLPAEVFNEKDCPEDDLWPCREAKDARPLFFDAPLALQWSAKSRKGVEVLPEKKAVVAPLDMRKAMALVTADGQQQQQQQQQQLVAAQQPQPESSLFGGLFGQAASASQAAAPRTAHPYVASRTESCSQACARWRVGGRCSSRGLAALNTCEELSKHFDCANGCQGSVGSDQPARVSDDAPAASLPGVCLVNGGGVACEGSHKFTTRLCACEQ